MLPRSTSALFAVNSEVEMRSDIPGYRLQVELPPPMMTVAFCPRDGSFLAGHDTPVISATTLDLTAKPV